MRFFGIQNLGTGFSRGTEGGRGGKKLLNRVIGSKNKVKKKCLLVHIYKNTKRYRRLPEKTPSHSRLFTIQTGGI